jgi:flavorubredoxin
MEQPFKAIKVTDNLYWVGAIDWGLRDFHGYSTERGSTYNAFLILADKITLVDTVKAPFKEEMLSRIRSIIEPERIDYIISNHSEMDHSGCLPEVIEIVKPEKVFASVMGVKALFEHFHLDRQIIAVKDGEGLSLGNTNLTFFETRMLHWPDSMFTYLAEEKLLFSQDAFGMHLASSERFDDEIDDGVLEYEARKYFANILLPYAPQVTKLLEKLGRLNLSINIIAPDHGPIWRKGINRVLDLYGKWALQKPTKKAVVAYDTMWGSTAKMATAIGDGLKQGGANPKLMPLQSSNRSDVATEILDAGALLVGSPTLNNNIFPTVADVLTYIKGLKPRNLIGGAFGSYGWSPAGLEQVRQTLQEMKVDLLGEPLQVKYVPDPEALEKCFSWGVLFAEKLKEVCEREP